MHRISRPSAAHQPPISMVDRRLHDDLRKVYSHLKAPLFDPHQPPTSRRPSDAAWSWRGAPLRSAPLRSAPRRSDADAAVEALALGEGLRVDDLGLGVRLASNPFHVGYECKMQKICLIRTQNAKCKYKSRGRRVRECETRMLCVRSPGGPSCGWCGAACATSCGPSRSRPAGEREGKEGTGMKLGRGEGRWVG
jgi:hypothetical protein